MSNSPNMNMPVPVAEVTDGPEWASDIEDSLNIIDSHTHNPGSGVPITPSGININADLTMGGYNLTSINSLVLSTHSGTASLVSIYSDGTNLYYKDGSGNAVQITSGGNVNAGAGSITGLPSGTAGVSYTALTGTYTFTQATSTAANIDAATLTIRYPGSYPTPSGNFISLQAPSSLATGYSLTLPATLATTSGAFLTSNTSGVISYTNTDSALSSGSTLEISGGTTLQIKALGVNTAQLAANAVTTAKITDLNVTTGKLAASAVTTAKIADSNVTGAKIEDNVNIGGANIRFGDLSAVTMASDTSSAFKIIRGVVTAGGTKVDAQSENFIVTSHITGGYTLSWAANQFTATPTVVVGVVDTTGRTVVVSSVTTIGCTINAASTTSPFSAADTAFSFIAIGPR